MTKASRWATIELLDEHSIFVKSTKTNKTFTIIDADKIISISFDTKRFYKIDYDKNVLDETNDFAVNYTTELADRTFQHCKYYFDRDTMELTGTYKAKAFYKKKLKKLGK